jgi:hypothetical protein
MYDIHTPAMENANILDNDTMVMDDDDTNSNIFHLTSKISDLVENLSSNGVAAVRYPIGDTMYRDLAYHARHSPIVNIHVCAYQRQVDMRKRPFVQYFLRFENNELAFYNKLVFTAAGGDLYVEATTMLKILMAHYGKFLVDDSMYEYTGFHMDRNDMYVFFDVTATWVAYHFLNMSDPFWTIMVREIIDDGFVCGRLVASVVRDLFTMHPELGRMIDRAGAPYALPRTGYSLEKKKDLDRVLLFGMHSTPLPALGGNYFQFMTSYDDCVIGLTAAELKDNIVVRYGLMCDDPVEPAADMVYEGDLEGAEGTSYFAMDAVGRSILAVKDFYAQTTITAYNALARDDASAIVESVVDAAVNAAVKAVECV